LSALFHDDERPAPGAIEAALAELRESAADRGVELVEVASGWRFQVQADVHAFVARLWTERQVKYTRATLETLALIAYRQPITRGEIEQIRGVGVNANTIKMLEEREWIRVIGHRDVPGKPELFGTTRAFLDYFGLKNLDDLPSLAELKEIPELEPQLPFEGNPPPVATIAFDTDADADAGNEEFPTTRMNSPAEPNEEAGNRSRAGAEK
jgi:segregation and condensation protein B